MQNTPKNTPTKYSNRPVTSDSRNELIAVIQKNDSLVVDARTLHDSLNVGRDFSTWIKDRIKKYRFIEGQDFSPNLGKSTGGRQAREYHLTMDMAKELCMLEENEIGRRFRRYFIEKEKELRTKRLYAQTATLTAINKLIKPVIINGRRLYELRKVREALGYSLSTSTSGIHKTYGGLIVIFDKKAYIAEEYVKVLMSNATARAVKAEAVNAKPVLPANFGQMPIGWKGGPVL